MVKIIGIMQVGGNYDWILPKSLKVLSELTDEVVLVGRGHVTELAKKTMWQNLKVGMDLIPVVQLIN